MKINKILVATLLGSAMFLSSCGGDQGGGEPSGGTTSYDIKVWVSENDTAINFTEQKIAAYAAANNVTINATIEPMTEADAAAQMLNNVDAGPDLFCFPQDQLARLVQGGGVSQLGLAAAQFVKDNNDAGSVAAVTFGTGEEEALYAYPMTSDNGIFMYYDKSVISEEQVGSLESILTALETAGKKISWKLGDIWHSAGFFFGTNCYSEWITDTAGEFIEVRDNFNSDAGLIAVKGMKKILSSTAYNSSYNGVADFEAATPSAVVISGTWDKPTAQNILGENLGAAKLPSFTVDRQSYQIGSFSGFKLMGVKPQSSATRNAFLHKLAQYLTGEEVQKARFTSLGWGPSNLQAQQMPEILSDVVLTAFNAQSPYSKPQGNIHGSWWAIGNAIATNVGEATDEAGLRAALQTYDEAIHAVFNVTTKEYSVIGAFTVGGEAKNWDYDVKLVETDDPNVLKSESAITLSESSEFKIRVNADWGENYGADGVKNGANMKAEVPGDYYVLFDLTTHIATLDPVA